MKKYKTLLILFVLLWAVGFAVMWGGNMFRKLPFKKVKKEVMAKKEEGLKLQVGIVEREGLPVRCYKVALTDFKDDLPVMGTVKGALEIELRFEVNGVVESINFREGDMVYKGDLLATLDKKDAQLKVDYAKSKLESLKTQTLAAQKKLEIHRSLFEIGGIIKAKLEEVELELKAAELQVKSSEVELESAEAEFEKTNLHVPRDGVVGSIDAEVGEFVTPHDKIAQLYDTGKVFVELGIVEKDIDKIALGQKVSVKVDAYLDMSFKGGIDNVFPIIEGKSRTLTVKVGIDNPDAFLLPGMFARSLITVAEFNDAIVIPSMSLNKTEEGYKVNVIDGENKVSIRPIAVEYVTTDYSVIGQGLSEGELVVTETPQELKDGMQVEVIEVQESSLQENLP